MRKSTSFDRARAVGEVFEDQQQVANRNAFAQQILQHALHFADGEQTRHEFVDDDRVVLLDVVEQRGGLLTAEQIRRVRLDQLGEMRRDDAGRIDDGIARQLRVAARVLGNPQAPAS